MMQISQKKKKNIVQYEIPESTSTAQTTAPGDTE